MTTEDFKRKLTAVFSADVAGYSRLMAEDEIATVKTLETYREVMSTLIKQHRGRVIDSPGDNLLAEFSSVVDAVQCAVAVQKEFQARNAGLPENRRMEFRIGVNLGDVIEEGERIYGDGVNIAARLEALADPGGICVSKTAFDHIESKLPLGYEYIGEQEVKNIPKPVGTYRVLLEPRVTVAEKIGTGKGVPVWRRKSILAGGVVLVLVVIAALVWSFYFRAPPMEVASQEKMAFPLPDKPSIAVLPFVNMSEDPKQEYFSDGLTEEIITALSKVPKLFVIARNSMFSYKGKSVKVNQVAEELSVRYVLEGSVRKSGDRVRITAQLIDALSGHHLWAERYEKDLKDIFALQDEITMKIIMALQVKLTEGEQARLSAKGTQNLQAYLKLLQGREPFYTITKEGNARARGLFEEAIALDPEYASASIFLGATHWMDIFLGSSKSPQDSLDQAFKFIRKGKALDESHPWGHSQLGWLYVMTRQYDKGIAECEKAIALAPNFANAYIWMSLVLSRAGRHEDAVGFAEQALRLDPLPSRWYFRQMGSAYSWVGRDEEAITFLKKALQGAPKDILSHLHLTIAYSRAGHLEEARAQGAEVLKINPQFSLEVHAKRLPYKKQADRDRYLDGLRKAGLPERPPLPLPDKPSIAVLPFVNMSDDPKQEFLCDGMTEDIITALSKNPGLFVIARNSSFTYKGKSVKVKEAARELGVRYVLEGSLQKAGDRIRITAQLIDAGTENHLWAERYDRELKDLFALQDEITVNILKAMELRLTKGERARSSSRGVKNLDAYLKVVEGQRYMNRLNPDDRMRAKKLFEEAIAIDPEYVSPYVYLGVCHVLDVMNHTTKSPRKSIAEASKLAQKAQAMDEYHAHLYTLLGMLHMSAGEMDKAIAAYERAVELNPNDGISLSSLGLNLTAIGKPQEAIPILERALRVDPLEPSFAYWGLGMANRAMERYEEAITYFKKSLEANPRNLPVLVNLAPCYVILGRDEEARGVAVEILKLHPKFSVERWMNKSPAKDPVKKEKMKAALLKAGLPE